MLDAVKRFFDTRLAPREPIENRSDPGVAEAGLDRDKLALAACALLLELAHADDEFTDDERRHIENVLTRHFRVSPEEVGELIALADQERRRAVDLYQFTSLITNHYDEGQRMVLAEVMWGLVYADGELAKHESYLMQRLSTLLDLRPGFLAEARKRALHTDID